MAKRGVYGKGVKTFPSEVKTPETPEEFASLNKDIVATQRNIKRWEVSHPENCGRAQAFLQLQEAARAAFRSAQSADDRRKAARAGKDAYAKQNVKVQKELAKLADLGRGGFELAEESNHTGDSLGELQEAAKAAVETAAAPLPSRKRKVDTEKEAIDKETEEKLAAIDSEVDAMNKETEEQLAAIASGKAPVA